MKKSGNQNPDKFAKKKLYRVFAQTQGAASPRSSVQMDRCVVYAPQDSKVCTMLEGMSHDGGVMNRFRIQTIGIPVKLEFLQTFSKAYEHMTCSMGKTLLYAANDDNLDQIKTLQDQKEPKLFTIVKQLESVNHEDNSKCINID